ncbi:hypothetical protein OJ997_06540 [Solirubrobacter phytolaccae]|uniref:Transcriptional regulator n=1 Tax=Solirubrobacter phytolaccae TaxID=1404360 RepID=A0A9X3SA58_9ACTN|nr:hypothetical protein [Solirubrobacter phytolaccae]MDA0179945.1 hypothetical protein [Solirubrobacter phytolaccae]
MRERGGTARRATLVREVDASSATVARHLARMVDEGRLVHAGHGEYALPGAEAFLPEEIQELVAALRESGAEAHLTGLDVIGSHSHQFLRSYPHLVYADPDALAEVAFALSEAGFWSLPAGAASKRLQTPTPESFVLLRGQPPARMERFGVRGPIAPMEKAWLDLLREVRAGTFPASLADLGAVLAAMVRAKADVPRLRSWAREMGLRDHVDAVLEPDTIASDTRLELRELAAGARR